MDPSIEKLGLPVVDAASVPRTADLLVGWLRTFWTKLYRDRNFAKGLQGSRAIRCAQLYLDVLENARLLDHSKAPVFHRERWYPIVVRENLRNRAEAARARLGDAGIVLGEGPVEGFDEQIAIGEYTESSEFVAYALPDDVRTVAGCIVDSIASPNVVLHEGRDFRLSRKSIVLRKSVDPFAEGSGFPVFDVPATPESEETREAVLWACDALVDRDYLFRHVGYAVGLETPSDETSANLVRAVWDATTEGLSIENLHRVLGALCMVPCVESDGERVESIVDAEGSKAVVTDRRVYMLSGDAELRDGVHVGAVLSQGDFLDTTVRIYPFVVDADRVKAYSGYELERFKRDVSSLSIPGALISGDSSGFYVDWTERDVVCEGQDANDNPKLRFDLGLDPSADAAYWQGVWAKYERRGESMAGCFDDLDDGPHEAGSVVGTVVPIRFFLRNLVGANTLIVVVDTDRIPEDAPLYDPGAFHAFRKLVPSYVRLYFVEHGTTVDDEFGGEDDGGQTDVSATVDADGGYVDEDDDAFDAPEDDLVSSKWTRKCRDSDKEDYDD